MITARFNQIKTCALLFFCITATPFPILGNNTSKITQALPAQLCVQTFNTYGPFYGSNLKTRMRAMAQSLQKHPCDIIHLQEVWLPHHKKHLNKQLQRLGYPQHYPNQMLKNMGLMSILPAQPTHTYAHPFQSHGFLLNPMDWARALFNVRKGFGYTKLQWNTHTIHNYNTHLHPMSASLQQKQLQELRNHILQHPKDERMILAGDFNLSLSDPLIQDFLKQTQLLAVPVLRPTYDQKNPFHWGGGSRTIDHIFYKNLKLTHSTVNLESHQGTILSDHFGVRAWFQ